jgi:lactoylglutathione lyase
MSTTAVSNRTRLVRSDLIGREHRGKDRRVHDAGRHRAGLVDAQEDVALEHTFGLRTDFVVPGEYAQMDTGPTKLGFATYALARGNFDGGVRPAGSDGPPPNVEIALVAEDVDAAYRIAVDAGCEPLAAPADKPQGQRVGYVRDPFGMLVELATPL